MMLVVVVVFPQWRFLHFQATFPCHQHSTPASQAHEGLHRLWALPWLLSFALLLPGFSVTVLPRALRFWVGIIYPQTFFTLRSFTDIFGTFCDSDAGRNTQSSILLCACPHRVVPSGWRWTTHRLLQDHWFINCASEPWNINLKLNHWIYFACSKYMERL